MVVGGVAQRQCLRDSLRMECMRQAQLGPAQDGSVFLLQVLGNLSEQIGHSG